MIKIEKIGDNCYQLYHKNNWWNRWKLQDGLYDRKWLLERIKLMLSDKDFKYLELKGNKS